MSIFRKMFVGVMCSVWAAGVTAQELSPRAYWPAPKGTNLAVFGYMYLTGDVVMDPSIPITDGDSRMNTAFAAYLHTFSLFGRTANFLIEQPYSWGTTEGLLFGTTPASRDSSGFNDLAVTLGVNIFGAPSMNLEQFQELRADPHPILGATVKVIAPTGQYYDDRLVNIGANRWAVKPELGYMFPLEPGLLLEFEAGVWFFGDDDDFVVGKREQDPIYAGEVHLIKRFKPPGFWASLEYNFWEGGRQTIGGNTLDDVQRNSRIGGTIVVPVRKGQVVKFGYSKSIRHEFGGDYDQYLVTTTVLF
ncbi:MAG: transporter [Planctomycetota bacterium]|jgi:hypothetical protein